MASQKALDAIGKSLQAQCERWQPRARSKLQLDPTVEASSGQVKLRLHEGAGSDSRTNLKDFGQLLVDADKFASQLQVWLQDKLAGGKCRFRSPFQLNELQELDYALEGVVFGQAVQMPLAVQKPELSGFATGADVYMALEDFIFTSAQVLWENFWRSGEPLPFFVSSARSCRPQCQSAGLSQVKSDGIPGAALVGKNRGNNVLWENIAEVVELESREAGFKGEGKFFPGMKAIAQGLFHGLLMLVSRAVYQKNRVVQRNVDTAYVLLVTANYGGVIRLQGDVLKLELTTNDVYRSAANWFRSHADVAVSPLEKVWNKLGNANWRDVGALQFLLATFYCIEQCQGPALKSIAVRVANHNARLQRHRKESSGDYSLEGRSVRQSEQNAPISRGNSEIVEVEQYVEPVPSKDMGLKLEPGTTVWLDNFNWQRGFYIKEDLGNGRRSVYSATSRDDHNKLFLLYIGPHPSQLESSQQTWEDMSTWYQVHRQTKILNILKQKGISSKYLPQLVASGRLVHSSPCKKQNVGSRCDHPYCGIPVLVTSPAGEPLAMVMEKEGVFPAEEALRCCHDCLSALRSAKSAGIQHGEITLDHVMRVKGADAKFYYVLVDWGHAVLGDRDSPGLSQRYAPTFALQQGKLCPASDSESLTYLLFILCGGVIPEFDSLEAVLKWRERAWSKRVIQLQLGEVSAVLKAFADYVDSLCRTPYPMDYDIWLRRLQVALHDDDASQKIEFRSPSGRFEFTGESSGGSGAQSS